jgi:predicted Zn finger-like uncharacterized protein
VKPGAFICPECRAALQIDRSKLPPGGARGRCPACKNLVLIPALEAVSAPARAASSLAEEVATRRFNVADLAPTPPVADAPTPAETETVRFNVAAIGGQAGGSALAGEDPVATRRLSVSPLAAEDEEEDVIEIGDEEPTAPQRPPLPRPVSPAPAPTMDAAIPLAPRPSSPPAAPRDAFGGSIPLARPQRAPSAARSRPPAPAEPPPAPAQGGGAGRVIAGLVVGALVGGGGGYLAILNGLLNPPPAMLSIPGGEAASWGALMAGAGGLIGALLGALSRPRR